MLLGLALGLGIGMPTSAHADARDDAAMAGKVGKGVLDRTRRGFAIGPHVGGYVGTTVDPSETLGGISVGIALYSFKVPTVFTLQALIQDRIKARAQEEAKRIVASGGTPDMDALARQVAEDVKREILGEEIRRKTLEQPKHGLILELLRQTTPVGATGARLGLTRGVGPTSLGIAGSFLRGGGNTVGFVGADVSLRLTPIGELRTPVFELFVRADYGFDDGAHPIVIAVGGRFLLDVF